MINMRKFTSVATIAALALGAGACGLGDKQEHAERIHSARAKAIDSKMAAGTLTYQLTPDPDNPSPVGEGQGGGAAAELMAQAGAPRSIAFDVAFDFAGRRAQLTAATPAGATAEPAPDAAALTEAAVQATMPSTISSVFSGNTIFVRRANLRPTEKRVWAKLDYTRLPDDEDRPLPNELEGTRGVLAAANSINPIYIVDLALGALAGSVEVVGTETVAGVTTTKYESNISVDRVFTELDLNDTELEARTLMLRLLLGRAADVRPAQFWVDDEGLLRKAVFEFSQRVDRNENNDLLITLEIPTYGGQVEIPSPATEETIEVERYGRMVRASSPRES
jgi:hypothetical protein